MEYIKILDNMKDKLKEKGIRYVFFGYCEGTKAYRLMCLDTKKINNSCDVEFFEHQMC